MKNWLRRWLGIENIDAQLAERPTLYAEAEHLINREKALLTKAFLKVWSDTEKALTLEKEQRHAEIVKSQNFVSLFADRITALEKTSDQEIPVLTRAIDGLKPMLWGRLHKFIQSL